MNVTCRNQNPQANRHGVSTQVCRVFFVLTGVLSLAAGARAQSVPSTTTVPPSAPIITQSDGLLTISASNASLQEILEGIRRQTGAEVDIPPLAAEERVAVRLGPGPARAVINALLLGSPRFDYLIVGSNVDPNRPLQILLFARHVVGRPLQPVMSIVSAIPQPAASLSTQSSVGTGNMQEQSHAQEPLPVRDQQRQMLQVRRTSITEELNRQPE
jgi:hypothetical protein